MLVPTIRKLALAAAALALVAGCSGAPASSGSPAPTGGGEAPAGTFDSGNADYDAIINGGSVADAATVDGNEWAKAVKAAGVLKVGGTETSNLFSLLDPTTGLAVGFDAGLSQLLSRYILGDAKTELTQVTVDTREDLLVNNQVDVVFATYSITPKRLERINFAGPYYQSQAAILVKKDNTTINSVADLAGKTVATQASSTGVTVLESEAPEAKILELPDHTQALTAVQQGRADAYVIDQALLLNALVANDDVKIVGEPFGPVDAYGIGVNKEADAKAFIDAWLQTVIDDGTWLELWKATIGAKTGTDVVPTPPAINSAGNA
jgi:glutamate transport system substrate-binding protein